MTPFKNDCAATLCDMLQSPHTSHQSEKVGYFTSSWYFDSTQTKTHMVTHCHTFL